MAGIDQASKRWSARGAATPAGRQLALYLAHGVTTARGLAAAPAALPGQLRLRDRIARACRTSIVV